MPSALRRLPILAALASSAVLTGAAAPAPGGTLTVQVSNVRTGKGRVHLDVCPEAKFLKDGCPYSASAPAHQGITTVEVKNMAPGRYAVQAFLDENSNDRVDRGMFGIPREGFGFSNNPTIAFSAPKFQVAAFTYVGGDQTIQIRLKYLL